MDAIRFLINALLWLVIFVFLLRVILQFARADFRNPISQAVVRLTSWLVLPLRRVIPPVGRIDLASIVALCAVELAAVAIQFSLTPLGVPDALTLVRHAALDLARNILQFYVVAIIIYVILSFVAPGTYSPAASLLTSICEPVLRPVRRIIPPIANLDLSPLFVLIGLQALLILLR